MTDEIRRVLRRDLNAVRAQLRAYPSEETIWAIPPGISNSAGTLALHLVGNLQHYLGAVLGGTSYVRDRPAEFSDREVPLAVIEHRIDAALKAISDTLDRLDSDILDRQYPEAIGNHRLPTRLFLTHLISHTAYHLGQIDYHRRLITGSNRTTGSAFASLMEES